MFYAEKNETDFIGRCQHKFLLKLAKIKIEIGRVQGNMMSSWTSPTNPWGRKGVIKLAEGL